MKQLLLLEQADMSRLRDGAILQLTDSLMVQVAGRMIGRPPKHLNGTPTKTYPCPDCDSVFKGESGLRYHRLNVHHETYRPAKPLRGKGRTVLCPWGCGKSLSNKYAVGPHKKNCPKVTVTS